ncbi:hypothetical protein [Herbaspirillum sp.]|nr:hypothetical protein [Herbaspirillum sp.]
MSASINTGLGTIDVSDDWLGSGLENSVKTSPGARPLYVQGRYAF